MKSKRKQRLILVVLLVTGLATATGLTLVALNENMNFFFSPSQIVSGEAPQGVSFRIGGMVVNDSLVRSEDSLQVQFELTDTAQTVGVTYTGILPDLFREGQGIVALGKLNGSVFEAEEVLAKHDENYMPSEVTDALEKAKNQ